MKDPWMMSAAQQSPAEDAAVGAAGRTASVAGGGTAHVAGGGTPGVAQGGTPSVAQGGTPSVAQGGTPSVAQGDAAGAEACRGPAPGADWTLSPGQVRRLVTGPGPRRLQVTAGRLWLTLDGARGEPARDVWLEAGEAIELRSGTRLLLEGWPQAGFALMVPPSACPGWQQLAGGRPRGGLSRVLAWLAGGAGPAPRARWAS